MKSKNIVLFGKPGSGKGTVAAHLIRKYDYSIISTGDILREIKKTDTEHGRIVNELLRKGNLVPNEIVLSIIREKLKELTEPIIIDGTPRTLQQGMDLSELVNVGIVLFLDVNDETIIPRLLERGKTSNREDDMNVDIIKQRLNQYKSESEPLVEFYEKQGILVRIDGEQPIEDVFKDVDNMINDRNQDM